MEAETFSEYSSQSSEGCPAAPIEFLENPGESVRVGFNSVW